MQIGPSEEFEIGTVSPDKLIFRKAKEIIEARIQFNQELIEYFEGVSAKEAANFFANHFWPEEHRAIYLHSYCVQIENGTINKLFIEWCLQDKKMLEGLIQYANENISVLFFIIQYRVKNEPFKDKSIDSEANALRDIQKFLAPHVERDFYAILIKLVKINIDGNATFNLSSLIEECTTHIQNCKALEAVEFRLHPTAQDYAVVLEEYTSCLKKYNERCSTSPEEAFKYLIDFYQYRKKFEFYSTADVSAMNDINVNEIEYTQQDDDDLDKKTETTIENDKTNVSECEKENYKLVNEMEATSESEKVNEKKRKRKKEIEIEQAIYEQQRSFGGGFTPAKALSKRKKQKQEELAQKRNLRSHKNDGNNLQSLNVNFSQERLKYYRDRLKRHQDLICNIFSTNAHMEISWQELECMLNAIDAKIRPGNGSRVTLVFQVNTITKKCAIILAPVIISQRGIHKSHRPGKTDDSIAGFYIKIVRTALTRFGLTPQLLWPELELETKLSNIKLN